MSDLHYDVVKSAILSHVRETFEEIEDGWIAAVSFPEFVRQEMEKFHLDSYIFMGGTLQIDKWRTMNPYSFYDYVSGLIQRRLN